ncbi:MAG: PQQ-binding-like beta-propeller repeat protein [Nocardia sp.]|nr:PQQ-binding-like beta-propeller repeat protein [Nocardia sp.]
MSSENAEPIRGRWVGAGIAAALALGAGLIIGGTALAVYSRYFAGTRVLDGVGRDFGSFEGVRVTGLPERYAATAVVLGAVMILVVAGIALFGSRRGAIGRLLPFGGLIAAGAIIWLWVRDHMPALFEQIRFDYPLFPRLPTALAAMGLVLVGAILIAGAGMAPVRVRRGPRMLLVAAAAAGLLISSVVGLSAVRAGDDSARVDHVTAAQVQIRPVPRTVGAQRYRMPIPVDPGRDDLRKTVDVVPAGAGFVVADGRGLTAYEGGSGAPRWHYRRRGTGDHGRPGDGYRTGTLYSADDGSVVLARWDHLGWIAFEAMTGEILWQHSEFTDAEGALPDVAGLGTQHPGRSSGALLRYSGDRLARYDARTGKQLWSTDIRTPGCGGSGSVVVTDSAAYRVVVCGAGPAGSGTEDSGTALHAATYDLRTGAQIANRGVGRGTTDAADRIRLIAVSRTGTVVTLLWMVSGAVHQMILTAPEQLATAPRDAPEERDVLAADRSGHQLLVDNRLVPDEDPNRYQVVDSASGAPLFSIPEMGVGAFREIPPETTALLGDEVVVVQYSGDFGADHADLRTWNRSLPLAVPAPAPPPDPVSAPTPPPAPEPDPTAAPAPVAASVPVPGGSHPIGNGAQSCSVTSVFSAPGAFLTLCIDQASAQLIGFAP